MQLHSFLLNSRSQPVLKIPARRRVAMGRLSALAMLLGMGLFGSQVLALSPGNSTEDPASEPGLSHTSPSEVLLAQGFSPPGGRGMPGRREGGGTRGDLVFQAAPPTALIPPSNLGLTLSMHPTLYFYVPIETAGLTADLVLLDSDGNTMYEARAPLPLQEGIVSIPLPASVSLEPERLYQWFFAVEVSVDDPSANIILNGWIRRAPENPELMQQFAAIAPRDQASAYTYAGLWYEALHSTAELRRTNPGDAAIEAQWQALLETVGLGAIAPKPLLSNLPVAVSPAE